MVKLVPFILAALLLATASVSADPSTPPPVLMRVDQAVGDLDKFSLSLRKIEPGLHVPNQLPALFVPVPKPTDPVTYTSPLAGPLPYYRMGPGYRIRVDRLNYLIVISRKRHIDAIDIPPITDGNYFEMLPANSVFELAPYFPKVTTIDRQAPFNTPARTPAPAAQIDRRLPSLRIDNRIDRRIEPRQIDTRVAPPQP